MKKKYHEERRKISSNMGFDFLNDITTSTSQISMCLLMNIILSRDSLTETLWKDLIVIPAVSPVSKAQHLANHATHSFQQSPHEETSHENHDIYDILYNCMWKPAGRTQNYFLSYNINVGEIFISTPDFLPHLMVKLLKSTFYQSVIHLVSSYFHFLNEFSTKMFFVHLSNRLEWHPYNNVLQTQFFSILYHPWEFPHYTWPRLSI